MTIWTTFRSALYFTCYNLQICLSEDKLANLNKGDDVAILGKITEFEENTVVFGEAEIYDGTVPEVAPRDDEILTGKLEASYMSDAHKWDIRIDGKVHTITFAEGEKVYDLKLGQRITIYCEGYPEYSFTDVKIISDK